MVTTAGVRLATADDVDAMSESLALAFEDDPVMCWLFGDKPPRPTKYLRPFFAHEGRRHLARAEHPDHYYLAVHGTLPDRRGEGIGAALMEPVLTTCDAEAIGAYLESSKESNVPYCERHGFKVVGEVTFPGGGPTIWPMWRDPQPPAA